MLDPISVPGSPTAILRPSRFDAEDWESWMKWDNPPDTLSPTNSSSNSPTDPNCPPPLQHVSGSLGSNSPSELESLPPVNLSPQVYQLPLPAASSLGNGEPGSKKRKSGAITGEAGTTAATGRQPRGKKISHNVIEKRYRSNLNAKIARLRDSVPELRCAAPSIKRRPQRVVGGGGGRGGSDSEGSGDDDGAGGLKFNKATVLSKATEYIQQLERQNQKLLGENSTLRQRLSSGGQQHQHQNHQSPHSPQPVFGVGTNGSKPAAEPFACSAAQKGSSSRGSSSAPVEGLIKVPESMRRLREQASPQSQSHYVPENAGSPADSAGGGGIPHEVQGLIPVPESFRTFRAQGKVGPQEHYAPLSSRDDISSGSGSSSGSSSGSGLGSGDGGSSALAGQISVPHTPLPETISPAALLASTSASPNIDMDLDPGPSNAWSRSRTMSRILIGSLAGLMLMEGFTETESDPASSPSSQGVPPAGAKHAPPSRRGLFALPSELLTESRGFREPIRRRILQFMASPRASRAPVALLALIVLVGVVGAALFAVLMGTEGAGQKVVGAEKEMERDGQGSTDAQVGDGGPPGENAGGTCSGSTSALMPVRSASRNGHAHGLLNAAREFLARQAGRWLGAEWLRLQHHHDVEEAAGRPARRAGPGRVRWSGYAGVMPRLVEGAECG